MHVWHEGRVRSHLTLRARQVKHPGAGMSRRLSYLSLKLSTEDQGDSPSFVRTPLPVAVTVDGPPNESVMLLSEIHVHGDYACTCEE